MDVNTALFSVVRRWKRPKRPSNVHGGCVRAAAAGGMRADAREARRRLPIVIHRCRENPPETPALSRVGRGGRRPVPQTASWTRDPHGPRPGGWSPRTAVTGLVPLSPLSRACGWPSPPGVPHGRPSGRVCVLIQRFWCPVLAALGRGGPAGEVRRGKPGGGGGGMTDARAGGTEKGAVRGGRVLPGHRCLRRGAGGPSAELRTPRPGREAPAGGSAEARPER